MTTRFYRILCESHMTCDVAYRLRTDPDITHIEVERSP